MAATSQASLQTRANLLELLAMPLNGVNLELVDVDVESLGTPQAVVRVLVEHLPEHERGPRIDLDGVAEATRLIDATLETGDPVDGAFTLEVSSPGLERPLITPAHFARFLDAEVSVKTVIGTPGERRIQGRLESADPDPSGSIVVSGVQIPYGSIDRARTVFRWGEEALPTANGEARKKGTVTKGQRVLHPKAIEAALAAEAAAKASLAKAAANSPDDAVDSSTHVEDALDMSTEAIAASTQPQRQSPQVTQ
jgi:ribosome maturation factor RimP